MAFSVSGIVDAVNSYLYSISDVNKLLTEGETDKQTSGLSGIFQKYLNKAVSDEATTDLDSLSDSEVMSALTDLKGLATSSAFDSSSGSSSDTGISSLMTAALPDMVNGTNNSKVDYTDLTTSLSAALKGETTGTTAKVDGSVAPATKVSDDSLGSAITSEITNRFANMDLESQIKQPFQNLDLKSEINQAFRNVDVNAVFDEAFRGVDLSAEIEKSINSHNKMNEAVNYNESRLQAYKRSAKAAAETSTFGDFRL